MGSLFRRKRNGKQSNWLAEYTDHTGKRIERSTKTPDKATAKQILAHWELLEAKRASGLIDPRLERFGVQANRPITDHAKEFIRSLESAGSSAVHINRTTTRLDRMIEECSWMSIASITPESVEMFASNLKEAKRSAQTIAHYLQVAKQFTRWLTRTGRIPSNPLETVKKPNPKSDRRLERRMLLPDEWPWLREAAGARAIIYETAIQTGLRSSEIRSIHPTHVMHRSEKPHILVRSGSTKDKQTARQYVTADLAERLSSHKPPAKDRFFELPDELDTASTVRSDLAIARESWLETAEGDEGSDFLCATNDAGEQFDFHALRHTCGAWLAIRGVHPKTIQTVMRHKSITLTMDTYGHLFPNAEPEAIDQIGVMLNAGTFAGTLHPGS